MVDAPRREGMRATTHQRYLIWPELSGPSTMRNTLREAATDCKKKIVHGT